MMRFTIEIKRGKLNLLVGELTCGVAENRYGCNEETCGESEQREIAFAVEKAINQHTEYRCHVLESSR
jgi:hypothetical protein